VFKTKKDALQKAKQIKEDPQQTFCEVWLDPIAKSDTRLSLTTQKAKWVDPQGILPLY
jgi:hypothetical protein